MSSLDPRVPIRQDSGIRGLDHVRVLSDTAGWFARLASKQHLEYRLKLTTIKRADYSERSVRRSLFKEPRESSRQRDRRTNVRGRTWDRSRPRRSLRDSRFRQLTTTTTTMTMLLPPAVNGLPGLRYSRRIERECAVRDLSLTVT